MPPDPAIVDICLPDLVSVLPVHAFARVSLSRHKASSTQSARGTTQQLQQRFPAEIFWKLCHPAIERARLHSLVGGTRICLPASLAGWRQNFSPFPEHKTTPLSLLQTSLLLLLLQLLLASTQLRCLQPTHASAWAMRDLPLHVLNAPVHSVQGMPAQ